jgi:hypothetical protein
MQKQIIQVFKPFFSFMLSFQEQKVHNMLSMMFYLGFKGLRLGIFYIGNEGEVQIVGEYD